MIIEPYKPPKSLRSMKNEYFVRSKTLFLLAKLILNSINGMIDMA